MLDIMLNILVFIPGPQSQLDILYQGSHGQNTPKYQTFNFNILSVIYIPRPIMKAPRGQTNGSGGGGGGGSAGGGQYCVGRGEGKPYIWTVCHSRDRLNEPREDFPRQSNMLCAN